MSAFNTQVNVIDLDVLVPDELPEGAEPSFEVVLALGMVVPVVTPQGVQAAITPFGSVRFQMSDREQADNFLVKLAEATETLPEKTASSLVVASNLRDVERQAEQMAAATAGQLR